jgi:hypothetical protein
LSTFLIVGAEISIALFMLFIGPQFGCMMQPSMGCSPKISAMGSQN